MGAVDGSALDAKVLVLNRHYAALRVVGARRAFGLLFRGLAEALVLDEGRFEAFDVRAWCVASSAWARVRGPEDDFVRTGRAVVRVPKVIRLLAYDRLPRQVVKFNRRNVLARDGHRCQYCGDRLTANDLSLDHVVPRSRGGRATWDNIVAACRPCNVRKGSRTPREAGMRLLNEPSRPRTSPLLHQRLQHRKYQAWRPFLDGAPGPVDLT